MKTFNRQSSLGLKFNYSLNRKSNFYANFDVSEFIKPKLIRGYGVFFEKFDYVPYYGPFTNLNLVLHSKLMGINYFYEWLPFNFYHDVVRMYTTLGLNAFYETVKYKFQDLVDAKIIGGYINTGFGPLFKIRNKIIIIPSIEFQLGKGIELSNSICKTFDCDDYFLRRRGNYRMAQAYITIRYLMK
jgi:hypothetical protein